MAYTTDVITQELFDQFRVGVESAVRLNEQKDAADFCLWYELFKKDNPTFELQDAEWAGKYDALHHQALWAALPLLTDDEALDLFRARVGVLLQLPDHNLDGRFRELLLAHELGDRDAFKLQVRDALLKNTETIALDFSAGVSGAPQKGTVGNLVREYQMYVGKNFGDALTRARFFTESKAYQSQKPEVKEFLKKLYAVVTRSNLPSATPEGFEEDRLVEIHGELAEWSEGEVTTTDPELLAIWKRLKPKVTPEERQQKLKERFLDLPELGARIKKMEATIALADVATLPTRLADALVPPQGGKPNSDVVIALMRTLARSGALAKVGADPKIKEYVKSWYEKSGRAPDVESLKVFPGAPDHVKNLVKHVFVEILGMDEHEAARQTLYLANLLKRKGSDILMPLAFFDEDDNQFHWT